MTPRNKVVILDADEPFEKTLEIALRSMHTRFPLVKGHLDNAIGLIHIKDLFKLINDPDPDLMRIKRELKIVPDTMPLDMLLKFFLREHAHLAMAVDEFGTPVGRRLPGQHHGGTRRRHPGRVRQRTLAPSPASTKTEFVVEGTMTLNDLGGYVPELELDSGEVTTVGGYLTQQLGRFPEVGETLEVLGYEARVTSTDGRSVGQVHFRKLAPPQADGEDEERGYLTGSSHQLGLDQEPVGAAPFDQFLVGAALDDLAVAEHQDAVGMAHGGQAVGDDQAGAAAHQALERLVDQPLALGIQRGGGLVEQQDARIGENGAGDGDALALAAGKFGAARADEGVIALGQRGDEIVGVGLAGGVLDFLEGCAGFAVFDVLADAAAEEQDFLRHDGDLRAHGRQRQRRKPAGRQTEPARPAAR